MGETSPHFPTLPLVISTIFFIFLYFSFFLYPTLDTWLNVSHSSKFATPHGYHAMCHPTLDASKNMKFRLPQNPMKFDRVTRFCESNSTTKSILLFETLYLFFKDTRKTSLHYKRIHMYDSLRSFNKPNKLKTLVTSLTMLLYHLLNAVKYY